jgi:ubiquinol oxidase
MRGNTLVGREAYSRDDYHLRKSRNVVSSERLGWKPQRLHAHHSPQTAGDLLALGVVKVASAAVAPIFRTHPGRASVLKETMAILPPLTAAAGLLLEAGRSGKHRVEDDARIHDLLETAKAHRARLLAFRRILPATTAERLAISFAQVVLGPIYWMLYQVFPRFSHRMVAYMNEFNITAYQKYMEQLRSGAVENVIAPIYAVEHWHLPASARLTDLVEAIQADEAHHRDANHALAGGFKPSRAACQPPVK